MVPHFGKHESRQRINNKSICMGYKICVLVKQYGYVIQFDPYQEEKSGKQVASNTRWWLVEMVVLFLMESLPTKGNNHVFMDNYFASFWLLCTLVSMISEQQVLSTRKSSISAELSAIKRWKKTQGVKWINGNQPIELFVVLPSLGGTLTVLCTSLLINFHHNLPN